MKATIEQLNNLSVVVKNLENKVRLIELDSFNMRHFDTALNAVSLRELDFVIENCNSRTIQDYAIVKKRFFFEKGIK